MKLFLLRFEAIDFLESDGRDEHILSIRIANSIGHLQLLDILVFSQEEQTKAFYNLMTLCYVLRRPSRGWLLERIRKTLVNFFRFVLYVVVPLVVIWLNVCVKWIWIILRLFRLGFALFKFRNGWQLGLIGSLSDGFGDIALEAT